MGSVSPQRSSFSKLFWLSGSLEFPREFQDPLVNFYKKGGGAMKGEFECAHEMGPPFPQENQGDGCTLSEHQNPRLWGPSSVGLGTGVV